MPEPTITSQPFLFHSMTSITVVVRKLAVKIVLLMQAGLVENNSAIESLKRLVFNRIPLSIPNLGYYGSFLFIYQSIHFLFLQYLQLFQYYFIELFLNQKLTDFYTPNTRFSHKYYLSQQPSQPWFSYNFAVTIPNKLCFCYDKLKEKCSVKCDLVHREDEVKIYKPIPSRVFLH